MASERAATIRTRAELARRLSAEIENASDAAALREIANRLDSEADRLEFNVTPISRAIPSVRN